MFREVELKVSCNQDVWICTCCFLTHSICTSFVFHFLTKDVTFISLSTGLTIIFAQKSNRTCLTRELEESTLYGYK